MMSPYFTEALDDFPEWKQSCDPACKTAEETDGHIFYDKEFNDGGIYICQGCGSARCQLDHHRRADKSTMDAQEKSEIDRVEAFGMSKELLKVGRQRIGIGDCYFSCFKKTLKLLGCGRPTEFRSSDDKSFLAVLIKLPDAAEALRALKTKLKAVCGMMMDMVGVERFLVAYTEAEKGVRLEGIYDNMEAVAEGMGSAAAYLGQAMLDWLQDHEMQGVADVALARGWRTLERFGDFGMTAASGAVFCRNV
mmetsp:Transcript_33183/g.45113  ORF Transcript_33183/g.45113 Transcript_33183/m.45113 type:complete len:250 (+) Transcript_33183:68-817(+)